MSFENFMLENEKIIRLGFFAGTLTFIAVWEIFAPRRDLTVRKWIRWANNLGLVFFNSFVLRILFPAAAAGAAMTADINHWGFFNLVETPFWFSVIASIVFMDFIIYLQHIMVHAVPLFWRLHRVHHADPDYDVTTGSRFHTLEIILSMGIKFAVIALLGPSVVAVILFEVILNAMAMFNHGNIKLPEAADKMLRWIIVTPDMHRVHHSIEEDETNSNFGFNLSIWDYIFGTYRGDPRAGHAGMKIGIKEFTDRKQTVWITGMMLMPFTGKINHYAINRRERSGQ